MPSIAKDYIAGAPALAAFFGRLFPGPDWNGTPEAAWDPSLVAALNAYQEALGGTGRIAGDELAVVTGQQPGLLTGPLFSIYKALTALKLAAERTATSGSRHAAIFWVASDDHDFEEVREAHLLTKQHQSMTLRYEPRQNVVSMPMYRVPLEHSLHGLIDTAAAETTGSEHREAVRAFLHESLDASDGFSDWFARILARLFDGLPLLVFSPHLPAARALAAPCLEREIAEPLASTARANEAAAALGALGYQAQVTKGSTECSFFLDVAGRRRKVLYEDGAFRLPEEHTAYTPAEMLALLHSTPERFSANVLLRPVVQQALFPAVAYVAGPGEIAYWAQLKPVFDQHEMTMPVVYPRAGMELTTLKLNKLRTKYGLDGAMHAAPMEELVARALKVSVASPSLKALQQGRGDLVSALETFVAQMEAAAGRDNAARAMVIGFRGQLEQGLARLEHGLLRRDTAQVQAVEQQVQRLVTAFRPSKKPQERHYSIFSFLFEHGFELIPRLYDALDPGNFDTQEFIL